MSNKYFYNKNPDGSTNRAHVTPVATGSIAGKPHAHSREQQRRLKQLAKRTGN